ncbi:MAG TPA: VOC family protein [Verrucomicrobiae bacterium]|nr:VOC family protein [Verrucomicrobiae bacterium]
MRRYDHIDLRVRSLPEVRRFYETLLPALGFDHETEVEGWLQYEARSPDGVAEFFGIMESTAHVANECRVAFWVDAPGDVDRLATMVAEAGAQNIEGPAYEEPNYYAVFFEDPSGNRLEICNRTGKGNEFPS